MLWVIVLAGGSGVRLAEEARRRYGYPRPKQFCDFDGRGTLLAQTLERARAVIADDPRRGAHDGHVLVVTLRAHRREAAETLGAFPAAIQLELPANRDTTSGIAVPLLHILARDPAAEVLVLPSDHSIDDERAFAAATRDALAIIAAEPERLAILGAAPSGLDDGVGWLVPEAVAGSRHRGVARFVEKPDAADAQRLARGGARVNTFVFAARASLLAELTARHCPSLWATLDASDDLDAQFASLPSSSFSRDVLERVPERMLIVPLPAAAGWTDVGTPERLKQALDHRAA